MKFKFSNFTTKQKKLKIKTKYNSFYKGNKMSNAATTNVYVQNGLVWKTTQWHGTITCLGTANAKPKRDSDKQMKPAKTKQVTICDREDDEIFTHLEYNKDAYGDLMFSER